MSVGHRDLFLTPEAIGTTFEAVYPARDVAADAGRVRAELNVKAGAAQWGNRHSNTGPN